MMKRYLDKSEASEVIELSAELSVILVNRLGRIDALGCIECARNIFLIDADGGVVWQVSSDFDSSGGPFTNITCTDRRVHGYRWDGGMYEINLEAGKAEPGVFMK